MKKSILALSLAFAAVLAAPAHAEAPHYYGSISISQSHLGLDAADNGLSSFDQNATGGAASLGIQVNHQLGFELGYLDLGHRDFSVGTDTAGFHGRAYGVSAVYGVPLTQKTTFLVKPGIFETEADFGSFTERKVRPVLGFAADYKVSRTVSFETGLTLIPDYAGSSETAIVGTAGVKMKF